MEKVLIIAGRFSEYRDFIYRNNLNPKQFIYVNSLQHLKGYRDCYYMFVGRYYYNPIFENGLELLEVYNMKELKFQENK